MSRNRFPLPPLFLVIFIDTFGYFLILPVLLRLFLSTHSSLLPVAMTNHAREQLYSFALMLSPLAFITLSPVVGRLSDRFGRKSVIAGCLFASLVGFLLPILGIVHKHVSWILIGRFIAGAGTTSQPVAQAAITDFSTGKQRAFNLSLIGLSMTLAMVTGPVLGSYLSDPSFLPGINAVTPYWAGTALTVCNILLLSYGFTDTLSQTTAKPTRPSLTLITPTVTLLLLAFLVLEICWSVYYQSSFLFLGKTFHYSTNAISLFAAYAGAWMCLGLTLGYRLWLKITSIKNIAVISLVVITVGFSLLCTWHNIRAQWWCIPAIAFTCGTAYPSLLHLLTDHTPAEHQGWILGIASTLLGFAWMVTGMLAASIVEHSTWLVMIIGFISALAATILFLPTFRRRHENTR